MLCLAKSGVQRGSEQGIRYRVGPFADATPPEAGEVELLSSGTWRALLSGQGRDKLVRLVIGQSRVLQMIAARVRLSAILTALTRVIEEQVDGALASLLLLSADGAHLEHGAAPSLPEGYNRAIDGVAIGPSVGSCGTAAFRGQQVIVTDIETDPLWVDYKHLARSAGLRACWSTPILSVGGRVLGTFAMYHREPARPTENHFDIIAIATHLAKVAIERDIAERERERLVRELQASLATRDEFLSVASHELRTPLMTLRLQTESLKASIHSPEGLGPRAETKILSCLRQLNRLERLVDDLLDVARLSEGAPRLYPEPGDLGEIVSEVVERFRGAGGDAAKTISLHIEGPIPGSWDRTRVEQVVTNLLSNALKYGLGRPIRVLVERGAERERIVVRDEGIGIASHQHSKIFERFGRAVSERHYSGLGLGLWISRQIAEALGGELTVKSELGEGATFCLELPRGL